jgi:orotate phosphoribosyltransferase
MSVAASVHGSCYITTTRENILNINQILRFEEPHSHASIHNMYSDSFDLNRFKEIIFVDDEITTGASVLNLIKEIVKLSDVRKFSILTILDWRSEIMKDAFKRYASENKTIINVYSLISGYIHETKPLIYKNKNVINIEKTLDSIPLNVFNRQIVSTD